MHYFLSFLTSLGTIIFSALFAMVCLVSVVYFQWIGFFGSILLFAGPGMLILYRREKRRGHSGSMEVEDKIGYERMKSGVDYFERIWRREKKDEEQ